MITANQIKYALGAVVIGLVLFGMWKAGCNHVQIQFDAYRLNEQALLTKEITDNETLKTQLEVSKNEAQTRIDALANNVRTVRVFLPAKSCIAAVNASSRVEADITAGELLSASAASPQAALDRYMEESDADAKRADELTEQCRVLQDWAAKQ